MQFKVRGDCLRVIFHPRCAGVLFSLRFSDVPSEGPTPFAHLQNLGSGGGVGGLDAASTCQRCIFQACNRGGKGKKKRQKQTFAIGRVTATAPACAHAAACITPDTKVRLTFIPSSRCNLAAASMPASVAGIC
jgi:hypothetical protein